MFARSAPTKEEIAQATNKILQSQQQKLNDDIKDI
jgi:hypothetical protein